MSRINNTDRQLVARYIDGELSDENRRAIARRLATEPLLREAVEEAEAQRQALSEAAPEPMRAPAGFAVGVLEAVRQQPSRPELVSITNNEVSVEESLVLGQRLLVAALILFVLGLAFSMQWVKTTGGGQLRASGDAQLMKELDEKVKQIRAERLRK